MFKINGKEYGFYYSVWAHCEFNDWIVKNANRSFVSAVVQKAVIMSKAYCKVHGGASLNAKEILDLPEYVFEELAAALHNLHGGEMPRGGQCRAASQYVYSKWFHRAPAAWPRSTIRPFPAATYPSEVSPP